MADTQEIDRLNRRITRLEHQLRGLTGAGGAGTVVTDHGALTGLADDDHSAQYHNDARANTWLGTKDTDDLAEGVINLYFSVAEETKLAGIETGADITDAGNIAAAIHAATLDATPLDADEVPTLDSSASFALIRTTWTSIKAFLKTYFDTLYNLYVHPNHTGDVTSVGDGATTIAADAVTYAKMQNVSATDKVLGRATADAGDVEEIALTAAGRALVDDADATAQRTTLGLNTMALEAATAFLRLLGVAGGQTAYGGTGSGDDLILNSTSHATKGYVGIATDGGTVNIGGTNVLQLLTLNAAQPLVQLDIANVAKGYVGIAGDTNNIIFGSAAGDMVIRTQGGKILFSDDSGDTAHLQVLPGGLRLRRNTDPAYIILDVDGTPVAQIRGTPGGGVKITNGAASTEWAEWNSSGNLGLGIAPQGKLHVHDGTAGWIDWSGTTASTTPVVIIPNGTGDAIRGVLVRFLAFGSTDSALTGQSPVIAVNSFVDASVGGAVLRWTCNADGSITVHRQSGTGTITIAASLVWL